MQNVAQDKPISIYIPYTFLVAALLSVFVVSLNKVELKPFETEYPAEAFISPGFELPTLAGGKAKLSDYRGKVVFINFWATWCAPCVREMPQLDRLKELVAANGVDVLAISEDRQGALVVKKFYAANKLHGLDILVDKGSKLIQSLKGRGLPTTVLFNKMSQEVGRVTGIAEWDSPEAVAFIRRCLGN